MHIFIILAVFAAIGLTFHDKPYNMKVVCADVTENCRKIDLGNKLDINVFYSNVSVKRGHIFVAVFCEVKNFTDSSRFIDRDRFSLISKSDLTFAIEPFKIAEKFKVVRIPDHCEIIAGAEEDYVLIFRASEKLLKSEIKKDFTSKSYSLMYRAAVPDTLLKIAPDDRRLKPR